jgi:hypothetical protein
MVPKQHTGRGFKGLSDYLLHDKKARTDERVEWTHTENMTVEHAHLAYREMSLTALNANTLKQEFGKALTGRKAQNPAYHLSLSWAKDQDPSREEMIAAGKDALKALGLERHQALFVCHNDEPQPHVHIMVNRVDRENGIMNTLSRSKRKLSAWAMKYEFSQGKILCEKRLESNRDLQQGKKPRHRDPVIREAWERSDSGKGFQAALAENGYVLAQGNKRVVVIDPQGKAINPGRELQGVKAAEIKARLSDLDQSLLPRVDEVKQRQEKAQQRVQGQERTVGKEEAREESVDRDRQNADWEQGIMDAAIAREESRDARQEFQRAAGDKKVEKIVKEMTRRQAVVAEWELSSALRDGGHDPGVLKALEQDGKILRLHDRETGKATDKFTTPEVREQERKVLDCAVRLGERRGWRVDEKTREAACEHRTLDAEQSAAAEHALSPEGLRVIQGRAGTGKSHTVGAVREALEAGDYRVIGLAPTNTVALDLKKDGFGEARTVHSLLWHIDRHRPEGKLDKNTVLVVDEAAMLDTKVTERLLHEAERGGSKVILVGDDRQLSSVVRGGMFSPVADRLGSAEISKVRRQNEAWDRQAAEAFAEGRFADGLEAYEQHGRISWEEDRDAAREALVRQWAKDTENGIGDRFVFAYTNEEAGRLNTALREIEIARGRVDPSRSVTVKTERFGTVELAQGDRVQFRSNDKRAGIVNGLLGTVQQAGPDGRVQVLAETGRTIEFSANDENRPEIQHGYAGTIYRGQGKTLDDAYLLHTRHWRDRTSYVALTRARDTAKLFVARDQARGVTALARQMGRAGDAGSSLQYATAAEIRRRETGKSRSAREAFAGAGRETGAQRPAVNRIEGKHQAAGKEKEAAEDRGRSPAPPDRARKIPVSGSVRGNFTQAGADRSEANDNSRRAELQNRQLEQRAEMERRQQREKIAMEERNKKYYSTTQDRRALAELEQRKRKTPEVEKRMEDLQRSLADAERRAEEQRGAFARRCEAESKQLSVLHEQQRDILERKLSGQQPERTAAREHTAERQRQGPSAGRGRERGR